jgi:hypothetical protein
LRLCEEADFGALNCQHTTKFDAMQNVQLTTEPAFLQNRCYAFVLLLGMLFVCAFVVSWCVGKASSFAILALCGWLVRIANVLALALAFMF